jgi:hypothetical protein
MAPDASDYRLHPQLEVVKVVGKRLVAERFGSLRGRGDDYQCRRQGAFYASELLILHGPVLSGRELLS